MVVLAVVVFGALMAALALAGCGGSASSSAASASASAVASSAAASSSAAATTSASAASASASTTASASAASASAASASGNALVTVDGVDVKSVAVEMVGDTPNLQLVFANNTDKDVEFDLSKFRVMLDDKDEVNFHLTKTTIKANTPYLQSAQTASPNSMKVGDSATIYYDGTPLGTYEVGEF